MQEDMEKLEAEFNEAFHNGGEQEVEKTLANEERTRAALGVVKRLVGNGIAYGMPLEEAIGFLDVEIVRPNYTAHLGISRTELEKARNTLVGILGEKYPAKMPLGALMGEFGLMGEPEAEKNPGVEEAH